MSLHWSKTTMVRKTQLTGFRQPHLMAGQGVGGRDRRGARHLSNCVSVTDPSTTLPLEPVENNLFFLTVSGRIHLQIGWRRGCFFFVLFFGFPCRTFQFSLLVKPRRSRHLVLWFDLWRRGSGGGRGDGWGGGVACQRLRRQKQWEASAVCRHRPQVAAEINGNNGAISAITNIRLMGMMSRVVPRT